MNNSVLKPKNFPFTIIRMWPHQHKNKKDIKDILWALKKNKQAVDEVWFATEIGFPKIKTHEESACLMSKMVKKIRALGIEPGLQIANTIGHGINLLQDTTGAVWPLMVDENGRTAFPAPCPRSSAVLKYVDRLSRLYAACQPSSVWIDDDLRINNHGSLKYGCFCPLCLSEFSKEQGEKFNRKSLISALHRSSEGALRLAWTKFNSESLAEIAKTIAKAVNAAAPACRLGFQSIGHEQFLYNGPDWSPVLKALAEESGHSARARLGHGYYYDHAPRQMINKSFLIARQISRLPGCVDQICPEIEGFNHNAFGKTAYGFVVESALDLAVGCNSLSYAAICSGHEPMAWFETLLSRIASWRPFLLELARVNEGSLPGGLNVYLGMEQVKRPIKPKEALFAWSSVNFSNIYNLGFLGLPLCILPQKETGVVILHANAVAGLSEAELTRILSGAVMMDGQAAMLVQERGFGKLLGVKVKPLPAPVPYCERISKDKLNGIFAGRNWNALGNPSGAFLLKPLARSRVLGHYEDRFGKERGVSTVLTENKAGGRVAVFGFYGWEEAPSGAKRNQYLAAADWISKNKMPALISSIAQVMVVPRMDKEGRLVSVFLLNAGIDYTVPLKLTLRGVTAKKARWLVPDEKEKTLLLSGKGDEKFCRTPKMAPWSVAVIAVEE